MPKVRHIIVLVLIAGAFWHFYGETFQDNGFQGVINDFRSDLNTMKENPKVVHTVDTITQEIQNLYTRLTDQEIKQENQNQPTMERPKLESPSEQSFSIHNVEIGDERTTVEQDVGVAERISQNEYGVDWHAYHDQYQNFFMVAYDDNDRVQGLYTNQDLITSTKGITFNSNKEDVLSTLGEPLTGIRKGFINYQIQSDDEYHLYEIDSNYVTIFYDVHQNDSVTAIQIISNELEQKREDFFGKPSDELRDGLEYQLFDLTNAARVKHGLPILTWEEPVRFTARNHSMDMADNNYFSHTNLEGQSPFDRMTEDDIAFQMAGENLAAGQPSSIFAHEGLMNSLGHRENILHTDFQLLAVGVAFNNDAQPYYTEKFLTK